MELTFATKEIRDICEKKEVAEKEFGEDVALDLRTRIADIRASENLADFPFKNLMLQDKNSKECYIINLKDDHLLKFCVNQADKSYQNGDEIIQEKVYRILIMLIG